MNLKYADDGETLQHAVIAGAATMQIAGEAEKPGRQIAAGTLDVTLAPDGSTPTALIGREAVLLTFPPEAGQGGRTIRATSLDAKGEPRKGLTRAQFSGNVQFRERVGDAERAANSSTLDLGSSRIQHDEDATFRHDVRFEQGRCRRSRQWGITIRQRHACAERLRARLRSCRISPTKRSSSTPPPSTSRWTAPRYRRPAMSAAR